MARTLVAVIDHNNNLDRSPSLTWSGDPKLHKIYSKRSKNWRAQVVKEKKLYDFWPTLVSRIMQSRVADNETILRESEMPSDHPKTMAPSIAMKPVPKTRELLKKSRFSKDSNTEPNQ